MKRILQVSQQFRLTGGSDRVFLETCDLLQRKGHEVIPFASKSGDDLLSPWQSYFPDGANFDKPGLGDLFRFVYSPEASRNMQKLLTHHPVDIAHLHIYYGKLTASILQPMRNAGIPIVQTLHEYKLICPVYTLVSNGKICEACSGGHFWQALPRRCNRNSLSRTLLSVTESYISKGLGSLKAVDHFITVSHFQRQKMIDHGVPPEKLSTLYNFVDLAKFSPMSHSGSYVVYFGRIESIKGVFTLLEAITLLEHIPLLIVGKGGDENALKQEIEKRNLKHVQFLGFLEGKKLSDVIGGATCVVVPSEWYETFGLTVVESFARARPVIASRIGGITELISEGEDGLLFEPGNALELREKIEWLFHRPQEAQAMGWRGRYKVEGNFTSDIYYDGLMSIYNKLL